MRMLACSDWYRDDKYLPNLWRALQTLNVEVEVVAPWKLRRFFCHYWQPGSIIHVHWIEEFCVFSQEPSPKSLAQSLLNLAALALLRTRSRIIWTVHDEIAHDSRMRRFESAYRKLFSYLCSDIIVMSEYEKQLILKTYKSRNKVSVIPHGGYIGTYPNQIGRQESRERLGIPSNARLLLHLGHIRRYKGTVNLINAFNQIDDPSAYLIVAGRCNDADLRSEITKCSSGNSRVMSFLEFIADEELQFFFNACDWVVLPFTEILNSGSSLLSLSFSRPIIVPSLGSLPELIADGKEGYFYQPGSDLSHALKRALDTPTEQWKGMCSSAYARALEFDWTKTATSLRSILDA